MKQNKSLTNRSTAASLVLLIRQIVVQGLNFTGNLCLARFLSINDYGFYGILFFIFSFILNFGDIGLAPSLIYQKTTPNESDRNSVFTAQLFLGLLLSTILSLSAPFICKYYKIDLNYSVFFHFISVTILILSFKSVPTVLLERDIAFGWLTAIEISQAVVFNFISCIMAYYGWGPYSFSIALLVRTLLGSIIVNVVMPNTFRIEFSLQPIKKHLKFGVPFQISTFVNVVKDSISPVIVGAYIGVGTTGVVNMASLIAAFPSMLLFILNRLFFPVFSRAKENFDELQFLFKIAIRISNTFSAIVSIFILIMCKSVIVYVFGEKWLPAQNLVYFFWTANLTLPSMLICSSLINALGSPKTNLKYNIIYMIITLGVGIPLVFPYGIYGLGIANCIVNLSMVLIYFKVQKIIKCSVFKEMVLSWLPGIPCIVLLLITNRYYPVSNIKSLVILFFPYFMVYLILFLILSRREIKDYLSMLNIKKSEEVQAVQ